MSKALTGKPLAADARTQADGEMARRISALGWHATAAGPMRDWPRSLQAAVETVLAARCPMLVWWGPSLVQFYNDAFAPVMGARHPDALGMPAAEAWAEAWPTLGPLADAVLQGGVPTWNERLPMVLGRNGYPEEAYLTLSLSPVRGEDGGIAGVLGTGMDETARVLAERRLQVLHDVAARAAGAETVAAACQAACAALEGGAQDVPFALVYLIDAGQQAARLAAATGLPPGSAASPAVLDFAPGVLAPWPVASVAASGKPVLLSGLAGRFGALPGQAWPQPVQEALVLPLAQPGHGAPAGVLIAGVSPLLVLNAAYRGFLDALGGHVAAALAHARAQEDARRGAEALAATDRAKTEFFSNVSHEFRTPLTLILGPVEDLLSRNPPRAEMLRQLGVAHRNGLRILRLVNALLDYSRVEAGRAEAVFRATDLAASTAELASNFRAACERAGLQLVVDCSPLPEPVYADGEMWEKIVLNLVSNAFKFTLVGEIVVTLRASEGAATLVVRDTGVGIPAAELPRIFERFYRGEAARGRTHEGTGIGLALVQDLVRLHGGSVTASSMPGAGAAFTVRMPFGTAHLPADRIDSTAIPAARATRAEAFVAEALRWLPDPAAPETLDALHEFRPAPAGERRRVLLADDNADMRDYVQRILKPRYDVETVADGQGALQAAEVRRPDLEHFPTGPNRKHFQRRGAV